MQTLRKLYWGLTLCVLGMIAPMGLQAQMQVSGIPQTIPGAPQSYNAMLQQLFGGGVVVSNLQLGCDTANLQAGWFNAAGTNLGLGQGLLLTSGDIGGGPGPNLSTFYTGLAFGPGDIDLDAIIAPNPTNDACIIEFDIVPFCDTIGIKYVFGSEEYEEFVNSSFNDVFAFFITGPNPAGGNYVGQNIAVLPISGTPVSINNVNCGLNTSYYICNDQNSTGLGCLNCPVDNTTTTVGYDGFTVALDAKAAVVACQSYHIKIAIADGGDNALDSGVFLEAGGVSCIGNIPPTVNVGNIFNPGLSVIEEGCSPGIITFTNNGDTSVALVIPYTIGGTAINGIDYTTIPGSVTIPAGQSSISIVLNALSDGLVEGSETIQLFTNFVFCGGSVADTIEITIIDPVTANAGTNLSTCSGTPIVIGLPAVPGSTSFWSPNTGLNDPTLAQPTATIILPPGSNSNTNIVYTLTSTDNLGCQATDNMTLTVIPTPIAAIAMVDSACVGSPVSATYSSFPLANGVYNWGFGTALGGIQGIPSQGLSWNTTGLQTITLQVSNGACISAPVSEDIYIKPLPTSDFSISGNVCQGANAIIIYTGNASPSANYVWNFPNGIVTNGSGQGPYTVHWNTPGVYTITLTTDLGGCLGATTAHSITVFQNPTACFAAPDTVCANDLNQIVYNCNASAAAQYNWAFGNAVVVSGAGQGPYTVSWTNAGIYDISLQVIEDGCVSPIDTNTVVVLPLPVAAITPVSDQCFAGNSFNFIYAGTQPVTNLYWDLGVSAFPPNSSQTNPFGVTYSSPGIKTVKCIVVSQGCKSDTAYITFTVKPEPDPNFMANGNTACLGSNLIFNYTGLPISNQQSYSWSFGPNANPVYSTLQNPGSVQFNQGGFQTVTLTVDYLGCIATQSQQIYVNPGPIVSAGNDTSFCEGNGPIPLYGTVIGSSPPYYYSWWSNPLAGGISNPAVEDPLVNPTTTTTYYFQVSDATGCYSNIDSTVVTVKPKPKVDAGPDKEICDSPTAPGVFLNGGLAAGNQAPAPFSYSWFPGGLAGGMAVGQDTLINPYVRPAQTTIYTLVVSSANGCSSDVTTLDTLSTVTVTVNPLPNVNAGPYTEICLGETLQMTGYANGAGPLYVYQWTPPMGLANTTSPTSQNTPTATTTYTLTVESNGCVSSDTVTITVHTLPTGAIEPPVADICQGDSVQLDGRADGDPFGNSYIYSWSPTAGLSNPDSAMTWAFPTIATTYTLFVSSFDCPGFTDMVFVNVKPTPIANITTQDTLICAGDSKQLISTFSFSAAGATPILYQWTPNINIDDPYIANPTVTPTQTTVYTVRISVAGGCGTRDEVKVEVVPQVIVDITADKNPICGGETTMLHAIVTGGNGGSPSYLWTPSANLADSTSQSISVSPDDTTIYIVNVSESICADADTFRLDINLQPTADIFATNLTGCVPLTAQFGENATNEVGYLWNFGDSTAVSNMPSVVHTFTAPGDYIVTFTALGQGNCNTDSTIKVHVSDPSLANFSSNPPIDSAMQVPNAEVIFTDLTPNAVSWFWDFGDGVVSSEENPSHTYQTPGEYIVTLSVSNESGCVSQVIKTPYIVTETGLFIPNIFTPNGDGYYDTWNIQYTGKQTFEVSVFDRWGVNLFNATSPEKSWKGLDSKDKPVSEGVYFYAIKVGDKVYNGNITLMR